MIARLALMLFLQNAVGGVLVPMFSVRLARCVNTFVGNAIGGENAVRFALVPPTLPKSA